MLSDDAAVANGFSFQTAPFEILIAVQSYNHTVTQPESHTATQSYSHAAIQPCSHTAIFHLPHYMTIPYANIPITDSPG